MSVVGSAGAQTQVVPYNHLPSGNHGTMAAAWMVRGTDHFDIFYERQHEPALEAIAFEAERAYVRLSFDLRHELGERMPLILGRYLTALRNTVSPAEAFVAAFGVPTADIDRAFRTYARTRFNDR
jgi:hypothetical protein